MSTEAPSRRANARRRRGRAFTGGFAVVAAVLAVLGLAGAAASGTQGPRVTAVTVDAAAAAQASGSRLIVTTNQSLAKVAAAQVEVSPAAPFTVDTAGRSVGVRFTLPLHDDTEYTVRIARVTGLGGGPAQTITERFRTPPLTAYLLQRSPDGDAIVRTDLSGERMTTVFRHPHIEDFRATSAHLAVSTLDDDGRAQLFVTDLQGRHQRALPLPGDGTVTALQSADRGELIGYTFTDATVGQEGARENALFTASLKDAQQDAAPTAVAVAGSDPRVLDWRFVPDTDSILVLTYDGRLLLSGSSGAGATDLGAGNAIDGIARGSSVAVVQRADGMHAVDLTDGTSSDLPEAKDVAGLMGVVTPIPGEAAGTVRQYAIVDGPDDAQGTTVYRVADDGTATKLLAVASSDSVLQTCVSPSARYAAVLVAPDVVDNPYDTYLMPMPQKLVTRVIDLSDGHQVQAFPGFDLSWCQVPPPLTQ